MADFLSTDYDIRASLRPMRLRSERHACIYDYIYDYIAVHWVAERRCDNKVAYILSVAPSDHWEVYRDNQLILSQLVEILNLAFKSHMTNRKIHLIKYSFC